jgi:hypothetical protein
MLSFEDSTKFESSFDISRNQIKYLSFHLYNQYGALNADAHKADGAKLFFLTSNVFTG